MPDTGNTDDSGEQSFAIAHVMSQTIDTFGTFADFTTALSTDLSTASALRVTAEGAYGSSGVLTVNHMIVQLNN